MKSENKPLRVGFVTIGCRANQADTARMISQLPIDAIEVDPWSEPCDIAIVNTCTVTARADADARKLIRRIRRRHENATIIVTGCAAQVDREKWSELPEVDHVIDLNTRDEIGKYIRTDTYIIGCEFHPPSGGVDGPTPLHGHKSRPFLKIQDGCSRGCAYCIVPKARGPERSRPLDLIGNDILALSDAGFREIVLTGVHLGRWGYDFGSDLNQLIDLLDEISLDVRFRFSSLEPMDLIPALIRRIVGHPKICPHLHLPLQSGDQKILDLMGRNHSLDDYHKLLKAAIETCPDIALGTDIMVGFPGEDDKSFKNTMSFLNSSPLTYLHIFTWSPRPGTRAAKMPGRPPGIEVKRHMEALKDLDRYKRTAFYESQNGKTRYCLIEKPEFKSAIITALSDNFVRVCLPSDKYRDRQGQVIPVNIDINGIYLPSGRDSDWDHGDFVIGFG